MISSTLSAGVPAGTPGTRPLPGTGGIRRAGTIAPETPNSGTANNHPNAFITS